MKKLLHAMLAALPAIWSVLVGGSCDGPRARPPTRPPVRWRGEDTGYQNPKSDSDDSATQPMSGDKKP